MKDKSVYGGYGTDGHGLTPSGRVVLDARVFGLITDREDCAGWDLQRMQALMQQVQAHWDRHGPLPSSLPEALRDRHRQVYDEAIRTATARGWDATLGDED